MKVMQTRTAKNQSFSAQLKQIFAKIFLFEFMAFCLMCCITNSTSSNTMAASMFQKLGNLGVQHELFPIISCLFTESSQPPEVEHLSFVMSKTMQLMTFILSHCSHPWHEISRLRTLFQPIFAVLKVLNKSGRLPQKLGDTSVQRHNQMVQLINH